DCADLVLRFVPADVEAVEVLVGPPSGVVLDGLALRGSEPHLADEVPPCAGQEARHRVAVGEQEHGRRDVRASRRGRHRAKQKHESPVHAVSSRTQRSCIENVALSTYPSANKMPPASTKTP